jgi:uncharacterized protein (TIGR02284 family)
MEMLEKTVDVLNDLVQINNDRITGYEKAIEDSKNDGSSYASLFNQMIQQSREYKNQLIAEIKTAGGDADYKSTTASGKIYRMWMDIKSTFQGKTDKSALELSEFGEDAAQKAYKEALDEKDLPVSTRRLIETQKMNLKLSHDKIKKERDAQKVHS